jgi:Uma2 family endonuclease
MSNANTYYKAVEEDGVHNLVEEPSLQYGISKLYTYADYLLLKIDERIELIKGRIMKMSAPNMMHQSILVFVGNKFYNFLWKQDCKVFVAPFDVRLPVKNKKKDNEVYTVVQPDIMIVCDKSIIDEKGICGVPDLLVEILSPGNTTKEMKIKFELYEEAGVKEYWIINPMEEYVLVYVLTNGKLLCGKPNMEDEIIESNVVKGFKVCTNDIFNSYK